MKQFRCGDVVPGCEWVTRNDDETELFEDIHSHAREPTGWTRCRPRCSNAIQGVITEV